ncbi:MAG: class I SAM-dependent methyltransferase [Nitrospiraceae bacterium]
MLCRLTKRAFRGVVDVYRPSRYELFGDADARFARQMHHALKCRDRLYRALRAGLHRVPANGTVVDFGPYPGSLLRLLRVLHPSKELRLVGAGLMTKPEFVTFMREECGAEILTVNLDPSNRQFAAKPYPVRVPREDGAADLVFALEIIEHLASPLHLLGEAFRILAPGGHLVITTPNVTRIGNVFKLLIGRTPHDRLAPPGYDNPDDEWQPHVREYAMGELAQMLTHTGFAVVEQRFFLGEDTQDCVRQPRQRLIDLAKVPFFAVPHLRGSLLVVGRKPA